MAQLQDRAIQQAIPEVNEEKKINDDADIEVAGVQPAPQLLRRRLKNRHVAFVGFGGGIGVGLFVGSGAALAKAGPLGVLLAFTIMGSIVWSVIQSIGEIATLLPSAGSFPSMATRFISPEAGFALGWNYFYCFATSLASELVAVSLIISYWSDLNPAIWITVAFVPMLALNFISVRFYGEAEVITSSIKVLTFLGQAHANLIILGIILDLGGGPNRDRVGFRYWKDPGAMNTFPGIAGALGRFLAFFSAFINSAFAYGGTEAVILTAAECTNPSRQIPRAARRVMYRIFFFYFCGIIIIGMLVPYTHPSLLRGTGNAASSPFVVAIETAGIRVLPSIFNACILTSAWSAGNTYIYMSSRALLGLSLQGQAPRFMQKLNRYGIPYFAVGTTCSLGLLAYLCAGKGGSVQAFTWLLSINALAGLCSWATLCVSYIRFYNAMKVQGVSRHDLCWKSPFQPYTAYYGAVGCAIIVLFSGFSVFIKGRWVTSTFISSYISLPLFFGPMLAWKIVKKSKVVKLEDVDLKTGQLHPDEEFPEPKPTTKWGKFLDWLL